MENKTVVLIDDHQIFIQGLKIIIERYEGYSVVGDAGSIQAGAELIGKVLPNIAIVDLNLGNEDGLDLIKLIKKNYPDVLVIVLSMLDERHYAERSLLAGARGYIMKEETAEVLFDAMEAVCAGKVWMSEQQRSRYLDAMFSAGNKAEKGMQPLVQKLSDRQLAILSLMGKGFGSIPISEKLSISPKTVEAHKAQLKKKLGCSSAQELLRFAIDWVGRNQ